MHEAIERARASEQSVVVTIGYFRYTGGFGAKAVNGYSLPLADNPECCLLAEHRELWSALEGEDDVIVINVLAELGYRLVAVVAAPDPAPFDEGDHCGRECGEADYGPEQRYWVHLWARSDRMLYFVAAP